jgi:hypothetical protein
MAAAGRPLLLALAMALLAASARGAVNDPDCFTTFNEADVNQDGRVDTEEAVARICYLVNFRCVKGILEQEVAAAFGFHALRLEDEGSVNRACQFARGRFLPARTDTSNREDFFGRAHHQQTPLQPQREEPLTEQAIAAPTSPTTNPDAPY